MQAVMIEKALYKVPHDMGWFDEDHKHTNLGSEDEEDEIAEFNCEKTNNEAGLDFASVDKQDDDFKKVVN